MPKIKRAIISVYDKHGVVELAKALAEFDIEIISTGGTARHLLENGIKTTSISDLTGFPEILAGRVKTLHPRVFAGLLALRENKDQMAQIEKHDIATIDLVVVNLYPFETTIAHPDVTLNQALENIDIGGPSLIRAAAKNFPDVTVVTAQDQYRDVISELRNHNGETSPALRRALAASAFSVASDYDFAIAQYLNEEHEKLSEQVAFRLAKVQSLRYGENPHQSAAFYKDACRDSYGLPAATQLHGKELSFNNIIDLDAAWSVAQDFSNTCAVIIKHTNPCGVAVAESQEEAFLNAKATDPVSSFGGVIGFNRNLDKPTAAKIAEMFVEAVIAPGFQDGALEILKSKKNLRLLKMNPDEQFFELDLKRVYGGFLLQERDQKRLDDLELKVVSKRQPTDEERRALRFGWQVCKWVKSNAIVYANADRTIGIGAGQMSRVDSSTVAIQKARNMGLEIAGTIMASDAFFPFRDGVDAAAEAGATAIIQPGGSIRDEEVIKAADEHDMAMIFTGVRHFRH